jgi:hypothetical protein
MDGQDRELRGFALLGLCAEGWPMIRRRSDSERRAALRHSDAAAAKEKARYQLALLRQAYARAVGLDDVAQQRELDRQYQVLEAEWRQAYELEISTRMALKEAQAA